jgi:hypothetical protein
MFSIVMGCTTDVKMLDEFFEKLYLLSTDGEAPSF